MKSLREARKAKRLNQAMLAALVGVHRESISLIERGLVKPTTSTKHKFEKVLGRIDWVETDSKVQIKDPNYFEAQRLVKVLVSITAIMDGEDLKAIKRLIHKYYK